MILRKVAILCTVVNMFFLSNLLCMDDDTSPSSTHLGKQQEPADGEFTEADHAKADSVIVESVDPEIEVPANGVIKVTYSGDSYQSLTANPAFQDFTFDGRKFIAVYPFHRRQGAADPDLNELFAALFLGVESVFRESKKTDSIPNAAQNFVRLCVLKLQPYSRHQKLQTELEGKELPQGVPVKDAPEVLQHGFERYNEYLSAGLFHVLEFMSFFQYCDLSIEKITDTIQDINQRLSVLDRKDAEELRGEITKYAVCIERLKCYKCRALFLLHGIYPYNRSQLPGQFLPLRAVESARNMAERAWFGDSMIVLKSASIPTPTAGDDPVYTNFLKRVFATDCAFLKRALEGNIQFLDIDPYNYAL